MLQKRHDDIVANAPSELPEGIAILQDPALNKGTAFTEAERIASEALGNTPAHAEYSESLPTGMPMPFAPRSPRPRMRSPSLTTMIATSRRGQLASTSATRPRSAALTKMPRGR